MDDIFCIFKSEVDKESFMKHLNDQHPNLEFTCENGTGKLPFLDVNVELDANGVRTSVYRKPTHTGVFLNLSAFAPIKWKFGLIFCLLHRAYEICSSQDLFNLEVKRLRDIFSSNGYSYKFFNDVLSKFLAKKDAPVFDNPEK